MNIDLLGINQDQNKEKQTHHTRAQTHRDVLSLIEPKPEIHEAESEKVIKDIDLKPLF